MFAFECLYSGHFSWKAYRTHKLISVFVTLVTCGIGALFARGAKFSKYGYKLTGHYWTNVGGKVMVGKALIKEVGYKAILKAAGVQLGKKIVTAAGLATLNKVVEKVSSHLQKNIVDKVSQVFQPRFVYTTNPSMIEFCRYLCLFNRTQ